MSKFRMVDKNLEIIREKIFRVSARRSQEFNYFEPCLVAVSKFHPPEAVIQAYNAGQRHFGENYVNELVEKSSNPEILESCKDIRWHFIGHLQRNKVNKLLSVNNLHFVETVDSDKIASALDNAWPKFRKSLESRLNVMVQVNTSREEAKSGCEIEEVPQLVKHIQERCGNLEFRGLMTIGQYGYDITKGPNPDFLSLIECRKNVCDLLDLDMKKVELSMGMSTDFEHAIEIGSAYVRIGTAIFGERPIKGE